MKKFEVSFVFEVRAGFPEGAILKALDLVKKQNIVDARVKGRSIPEGPLHYDPSSMAVCQNCGHVFVVPNEDEGPADIPNLLMRVSPGEELPVCECHKCGALAHHII